MLRLRMLPAVLLSCLVLAGCAPTAGAAWNARVGTWKTAQTIQPFFYQSFLADTQTVTVSPFTNPGDMKTALLAGSLDLCGTTVVTAIMAASRGEPVVLVCGLSNRCSALVVAADSGITSAADLRGRKIAYVPGTMHHLLLLETLDHAGLSPDDVELVRIDFFDMGQAMARGSVDAFYSGEPYPSIAVAEGYGRILLYPDDKDGFGVINSAMMTTRDALQNKRDLLLDLVVAHARATEKLQSDRTVWLDSAAGFGTKRAVLEIAADNIELFWQIDNAYVEQVRKLAGRMVAQGLIPDVPDLEALIDFSLVQDAQAELDP